jgi:acylphosphatase
MDGNALVRVFAVAAGRVQGVGFRCFVQTSALKHAVTGWVRNMNDGTVEMELQGREMNVHRLLAVIEKGNMFCRVDGLECKDLEVHLEENEFKIAY